MQITRETPSRSGGAPEQRSGTDGSSTLRKAFADLDRDRFCKKYYLSDEIQQLLDRHGFDTADSLLDVSDLTLQEMGFKVGHIAELKWALEKMLWERFPATSVINTDGKYTPIIFGGIGGAGGDGLRSGGPGGTGKAPQISIQDVYRFAEFHGGTGGSGGASDVMLGPVRKIQEAKPQLQIATEETRPNLRPALSGGAGGAGGWGTRVGGPGGVGEAAQMAIEDVAVFRAITGGFGGAGGGSANEGGPGGTGEGSKFSSPLLSVDEETRRRLPYTKLEDFNIKPELRRLLEDQGFQTVGGLLEAYDTDLQPPHFKPGHVSVLTAALRKFAAQNS